MALVELLISRFVFDPDEALERLKFEAAGSREAAAGSEIIRFDFSKNHDDHLVTDSYHVSPPLPHLEIFSPSVIGASHDYPPFIAICGLSLDVNVFAPALQIASGLVDPTNM